MVERYKYKCIDAYEEPENPMEWLPCPRCGLRPLVWEFDNGRATACGCGTDCYSHWSVQAESIMSDYIGKVFHLLQQTEMRKDDILDNINNLSLYMNGTSRSSGEKNLHAMNSLFDFVFNQDEYAFPIQKLMEFKKKSNEFWANRIDNLLKYYKDNHVVLMEKDFEYTILMDEPDRNLDIDNIMDPYKVLSFHKPQTQIIAVIHNPALIYKLSKLDHVNFIEMTKGYLKKVVSFMNKNK